jgi:hypothetical protein
MKVKYSEHLREVQMEVKNREETGEIRIEINQIQLSDGGGL